VIILSIAAVIGILLFLQKILYAKLWDYKLHMKLAFSAKEAFEGDRLTLTEELTNAKLLPLPWVTAKFQLSRNIRFVEAGDTGISDEYNQNDMFSINMFQRITRKLEFICQKRGYYRIKSMSLVSSNLMASDKLVKQLDCNEELVVYPSFVQFQGLDILFNKLYGDIEIKRFTNPDPFAFSGIRDYRPGDAFNTVNFKATAKTGQLMVNINSSTAARDLVIILDVQPYANWYDEEIIEEAIRIAASAADKFINMGFSVGLVSNGCDALSKEPVRILTGSGNGHFNNIIDKLARIDLSISPEPISGRLYSLRDMDTVYMLVSCCTNDNIVNAYGEMLAVGMSARWILPVPEGAETEDIEATGLVTSIHRKAVVKIAV